MLNIAFGLMSDAMDESVISDGIRMFVSLFDQIVYLLIPIVYAIFIKITKITIISGDMVGQIYSRIQLILGVVMIFRLSISVIQYIIDPDTMSDKSKGIGNVIVKILIMLALFTAIVPLHIPKENAPDGSYNAYLRSDGLLFGSLYFFQSRVLETNVIGKLILGEDNQAITTSEEASEEAGKNLAFLMLKSIVVHENIDECLKEDFPDMNEEEMRKEMKSEVKDAYDKYELKNGKKYETPYELINDGYYISCIPGDHQSERYAFAYFPLVGFICGAFVLITLVSFCVDVAMRAIKMAILRLIAPIPILSYIDPKSSEKGAFSNWVKTLTKTYLDLFMRLAIIFFVIFVIRGISEHGIKGFELTDATDAFAIIFIIIGLFFFAKQAPQFIYEALGMEYKKGAGIFSGLGKIAGVATLGAGTIGEARRAYKSSKDKNGHNFGKNLLSAFGGGAGGALAGIKGLANAEGDYSKSAENAIMNHVPLREKLSNTKSRYKQLLGGEADTDAQANFVSAADNYLKDLKSEATKGKYDLVEIEGGQKYENSPGVWGKKIYGKSKSLKEQAATARAQGKDIFAYHALAKDGKTSHVAYISVNDAAQIASDMEKVEMNNLHHDLLSGKYVNDELKAKYGIVERASAGVAGIDLSTAETLDDSKGRVSGKVITAKDTASYKAGHKK